MSEIGTRMAPKFNISAQKNATKMGINRLRDAAFIFRKLAGPIQLTNVIFHTNSNMYKLEKEAPRCCFQIFQSFMEKYERLKPH